MAAGPKRLLTVFGIRHRLESCERTKQKGRFAMALLKVKCLQKRYNTEKFGNVVQLGRYQRDLVFSGRSGFWDLKRPHQPSCTVNSDLKMQACKN